MKNDRSILKKLFDAAVSAADPGAALLRNLPDDATRPVVVVGAGKASPAMAETLVSHWKGAVRGAVVAPHGYSMDTDRILFFPSGHPIPDRFGLSASDHLCSLVSGLSADDLVIALISGGGSSLLPRPPPGFALEDEIAVNTALLKSGAPISAMNAIRKQFSTIKGGRLAAAAYPARVLTYVLSDVPGDDPAQVASGPTVADTTQSKDALAFIKRFRIELPQPVVHWIESGQGEAPMPDNPKLANGEVRVIASAAMALDSAAATARELGLNPVILSDSIEGEAREVGRVIGAIAKDVAFRERLAKKPAVLLSGGETTVTIRGAGEGGRNTEFLLSLALEIEGCTGITAIAADTDGVDGIGGHAGAIADWKTCARVVSCGLDPSELLFENNSYMAFSAAKGLLVTGPTGTNVNDFRAVIVR